MLGQCCLLFFFSVAHLAAAATNVHFLLFFFPFSSFMLLVLTGGFAPVGSGNKLDLDDQRQVQADEVKSYADEQGNTGVGACLQACVPACGQQASRQQQNAAAKEGGLRSASATAVVVVVAETSIDSMRCSRLTSVC